VATVGLGHLRRVRMPVHFGEVRPGVLRVRPLPHGREARSAADV